MATINEIELILAKDIEELEPTELAAFRRYAVEPFYGSIEGSERVEKVVVVAQAGELALYWEDVEEGFNISPIKDGKVLELGAEQDDLKTAMMKFIRLVALKNKVYSLLSEPFSNDRFTLFNNNEWMVLVLDSVDDEGWHFAMAKAPFQTFEDADLAMQDSNMSESDDIIVVPHDEGIKEFAAAFVNAHRFEANTDENE